MSLISILHDAARHVDNHPSTAVDSGTEDRTTRHYFQRILNSLCGKQEYSANQVIAALIGLPSEYQMHKTSQIFADAAIRYVAETNIPDASDSSSDSDAEASESALRQHSDSETDSEASQSDSEDSPSVPLKQDTTLLDLLPTNLTEVDEFGDHAPLGLDADGSSSDEQQDDSNDSESEMEGTVREHEPGDAFTELMDSKQTHTGSVQIVSFEDNGAPRTSLEHHDFPTN
jgi:hypothetical protein